MIWDMTCVSLLKKPGTIRNWSFWTFLKICSATSSAVWTIPNFILIGDMCIFAVFWKLVIVGPGQTTDILQLEVLNSAFKAFEKDKTKASYWSCRLPRYAKKLGLSGGGTWW